MQRLDQLSYYPRLTARIRELAGSGLQAVAITRVLQDEGYRPAKAVEKIGAGTVRELMRRLGCLAGTAKRRRPLPPGEELGRGEANQGPSALG